MVRCTVKIKIKWMIRKHRTYENTYHDDIFALPNLSMLTARLHREFILRGINRMRSIIPTAHNSDSPLLRQPITPTAHYSDGPFFRQCKIELNPQIHGLTRCIQQDVPSVRLILTDHGLDRMFWKGKGAFILGCTSPFKEIMIDRPGIGKVKNWRKSCAHCTKNQKRGVKEKSVNREKHEKDKMTEDNNTHGSEES
jgi:hypothetical protein